MKSATGAAIKIPSIPKKTGSVHMSGIKQKISLINDVKTANTGFPTAWKKMDDILIMQVNVTRARNMRNVFSENSQ